MESSKNLENLENPKLPKKTQYNCDICDFKTSNKKDYGRHLLTRKHTMELNGNCMETQKHQVLHVCSRCNKEYERSNRK